MKTKRNETKRYKTKQSEMKQSKTKQNETKQNEMKRNKAKRNKTKKKTHWNTTFMIPEGGETFFYCYVDVDIGVDIVQTNSSLINRAKCNWWTKINFRGNK